MLEPITVKPTVALGVIIASLALGGGIMKVTTPTKTVEVIKTVEVEKKSESKSETLAKENIENINNNDIVTHTIIKKKDGTVITTDRIDKSVKHNKETLTSQKTQKVREEEHISTKDEKKTVEKENSRWGLGLAYKLPDINSSAENLSNPKYWGGSLDYKAFDTFGAQVQVFTDLSATLTVKYWF